MSKVKTLPLSSLIEDMEIYPRHAVDSMHVQGLTEALLSGATLPPIVADEQSLRITDGWHRVRAWHRFAGEEASVEVELVKYQDRAHMIRDAVARNATHGRRLDKVDLTRSAIMLQSTGHSAAEIATVMHVSEKRVSKILIRVASAPRGSSDAIPGTKQIALKRSVRHMQGQTLSKSQVEAHRMMPGVDFRLLAMQLCAAIREDMIDLTNEALVEQLTELRDALGEIL